MNQMSLFRRPSLMVLALLMSMGAAARPAAEHAGEVPEPPDAAVTAPAIEVNHPRLDAAFLAAGKPADLSERDWQALQRTVAKSFTQDTQISNNLAGRDAENYEYMGMSVAVDGNTAVIGASRDDLVNGDTGSARVYVRSGSTWTLQSKLVPSTLQTNCCQYFGYSVAISGDTIAVGAWNEGGNNGQGVVYVFTRSAGVWTQQARLLNTEGGVFHRYFGQAVDIDADTLIVGTPNSSPRDQHAI